MRVMLSLPEDAEPCWLELLRAALPDAQVSPRLWAAPVDPAAPPADYVVAYGKCDTLFDEQRRMKAVFTLSAGVGHLLRMPNVPRDVPIIRLEDAGMAEQMVRYVLAAALRFAQGFAVYARQQRDSLWEQHEPRAPSSIKAGVMGLGVIGAQVARALSAQGFAVRGYARSAKHVDGVTVYAGDARLDAFLDDLDFLVCVLPATPATEGILNRRNDVAAGRRRACRQHRPGGGPGGGRPRRARRIGQARRRHARCLPQGTVACRPSVLALPGNRRDAAYLRASPCRAPR